MIQAGTFVGSQVAIELGCVFRGAVRLALAVVGGATPFVQPRLLAPAVRIGIAAAALRAFLLHQTRIRFGGASGMLVGLVMRMGLIIGHAGAGSDHFRLAGIVVAR